MRDPSPELVDRVSRYAAGWARRRGYPYGDIDDVIGDALEWLCRYEPPAGWDPLGSVLQKLPWILATRERGQARGRRRHNYRHAPTVYVEDWDGIDARIDLDRLLAGVSVSERQALFACITYGDAAELASREGVHLSTIHHRARRARARVLAAMEAT